MRSLSYYQHTLFFFLTVVLVILTGFSWFEFHQSSSHPLRAISSSSQEDGGFSRIHR